MHSYILWELVLVGAIMVTCVEESKQRRNECEVKICRNNREMILNVTDTQQRWRCKKITCRAEVKVTPVIHVLQYPGCVPKPIPSFACQGRCSSYIQVSGSKIWQMERSCMCCQESGEREASVSLFCPKAKPGERKFRKVVTKAPLECMCRPCTSVEESTVIPQEIAGFVDQGPLNAHFRKPQ